MSGEYAAETVAETIVCIVSVWAPGSVQRPQLRHLRSLNLLRVQSWVHQGQQWNLPGQVALVNCLLSSV